MKQVKILNAVINTLQMVSVRGADDWNRMLGCVQALEGVRKELEANAGSDTSVQQRNSETDADTV